MAAFSINKGAGGPEPIVEHRDSLELHILREGERALSEKVPTQPAFPGRGMNFETVAACAGHKCKEVSSRKAPKKEAAGDLPVARDVTP